MVPAEKVFSNPCQKSKVNPYLVVAGRIAGLLETGNWGDAGAACRIPPAELDYSVPAWGVLREAPRVGRRKLPNPPRETPGGYGRAAFLFGCVRHDVQRHDHQNFSPGKSLPGTAGATPPPTRDTALRGEA